MNAPSIELRETHAVGEVSDLFYEIADILYVFIKYIKSPRKGNSLQRQRLFFDFKPMTSSYNVLEIVYLHYLQTYLIFAEGSIA